MTAKLEAAIDAAGRDKVFAIMRANGWLASDRPPMWTWWMAVFEARRDEGSSTAQSGQTVAAEDAPE